MFFKLILIPDHDSDSIFYRGKRTKHSRVFYTFLMFLPMPSENPSKSMDFSYAYRPGIWMADVINGNYIRSGEMLEKNQIIPLFGAFVFTPAPPPGSPSTLRLPLKRLTRLDQWIQILGCLTLRGRESPWFFFKSTKRWTKQVFSGAIKSKILTRKALMVPSVGNLSYLVNWHISGWGFEFIF